MLGQPVGISESVWQRIEFSQEEMASFVALGGDKLRIVEIMQDFLRSEIEKGNTFNNETAIQNAKYILRRKIEDALKPETEDIIPAEAEA